MKALEKCGRKKGKRRKSFLIQLLSFFQCNAQRTHSGENTSNLCPLPIYSFSSALRWKVQKLAPHSGYCNIHEKPLSLILTLKIKESLANSRLTLKTCVLILFGFGEEVFFMLEGVQINSLLLRHRTQYREDYISEIVFMAFGVEGVQLN